MAILKNTVVQGALRCLNTVYANDISAANLSVSGNATFTNLVATGTANIGSGNNANTIIYLNGKRAIAGASGSDYTWLRINDTKAFSSGVYFGGNIVRTDGSFQVGGSGASVNLTTSEAKFGVPVKMNGDTYYWGTDGSIVVNQLKASSGRVNNLFVEEELRALRYNIQTVADLGGTFIVAPTVNVTASASTAAVTGITGTSITMTIKDEAFAQEAIGGGTWSAGSRIKISGKFGGIPIGTCDGTVNSINTSSQTLGVTFTYTGQSINGLTNGRTYAVNATDGSLKLESMTVMLVTVGATNPIGIYMTSYDTNKYSHISLYGGQDTTPTVRIGNLQGLPSINGFDPNNLTNKWGIYTSNGFFNGVIISQSGKIGGWYLGTDAIYSSSKTFGTVANNMYFGASGISLGTTFKVTSAGDLTDKSGTIGGWTIAESDIHSGTHSAWNTASNGLFLGTTRIAGGSGGTWYLDQAGTGKIGRWTFASNGEFYTTVSSNTAGMGNGTYAFWAGAASGSASSAPFRVTYDGILTATSATITGEITATKLTVSSGATITGLNRNRTFTSEPTTPYEEGDLWKTTETLYTYYPTTDTAIDSGKTYYIYNNDEYMAVTSPVVGNIGNYYERRETVKNVLYVCDASRTTGSFDFSDWSLTSTDDAQDSELQYYINDVNDDLNDSIMDIENGIFGINTKLDDAQNQFTTIDETFGDIDLRFISVFDDIDKNSEDIDKLNDKTNESNIVINNLQTQVSSNETVLNNLIKGVVIDSEAPSVSIQLTDETESNFYGRILLSIDKDGQGNNTGLISISGESNTVSWFDNQSMYANTVYATNIMPRSMDDNAGRADVQMTGGLAFIARSNGHLSLKPVG